MPRHNAAVATELVSPQTSPPHKIHGAGMCLYLYTFSIFLLYLHIPFFSSYHSTGTPLGILESIKYSACRPNLLAYCIFVIVNLLSEQRLSQHRDTLCLGIIVGITDLEDCTSKKWDRILWFLRGMRK